MSGWDPHGDLARLIEALGQELICSGEPEVSAACFDDGDTIRTAARELRQLAGAPQSYDTPSRAPSRQATVQ
jgi:hypothetical protein